MTAASPVTDLLKILGRLCGVLDLEIEMLRAMKPSRIEAVQKDKLALTAAYEAQVKEIRARPELLGSATPAVRAELRAATERFERTLRENERGLRAAKEVTGRVLGAIAGEIERKRRDNAAYSANGAVPAGPSSGAPRRPVSIAVDERL